MSNKLYFPYKENTLDGVFKVGIRPGLLKIKYDVKLSSFLGGYPVSNCFDGNDTTFCHTFDYVTEPQYLQIHFKDLHFKIEGFAIQNRDGIVWDPLNYDIQGSNDGINFVILKSFNEDKSTVCGAKKIRTNKIETTNSYKYFRLKTTGITCHSSHANKYLFNIAEFDLFGSFSLNRRTVAIKNNHHSFILLYLYSILLLTS